MKTINLLKSTALALLFIGFTSCDSDDDNGPSRISFETQTFSNLSAPQTGGQGQPVGGDFTKFDFETGMVTTSETDWDIAFRGTTIAVNGGTSTGTNDEPLRNGNAAAAIVESTTLADVTSIDGLNFNQDSTSGFAIPTGSDNGWYNYNFMTNVVSPLPGTILVFRTRDNKYAKVEITSYYLNSDSSMPQNGRHYTFNYVYNPNEGETTFE